MRLPNVLGMGLLAGVALFGVGALFYFLAPLLVPSLQTTYTDHPELFRPWSGWTRTYMVLHPFGCGLVFAWGFRVVHDITKERGLCRGTAGGAAFGFLVFLIGSLPVYLLNCASFRVPMVVVGSWIAQSSVQYLAAGALLGCVADGVVVEVTTRLGRPASQVWEKLKKKSTFLFITRGMIGYPGAESWPETLFTPGVIIPMSVRMFHVFPATPHEVRIVRVDEAALEVETDEHGGPVRVWRHRMKVEPVSPSQCRYIDRIEICAGWLTPLVWCFACLFYRYRHRRWQRLIHMPEASV